MGKQKFKTKLEKMGSWTVAVVPIDVKKMFETGSYVKINGTIDNVSFSGISLMPMGNNRHCFPVNAQRRKVIKKEAGAAIEVILEGDTKK